VCGVLGAVTPLGILILFGERFRPSIPAALVLLPAAGVLGLNLVLQEGLRGMGRPFAVLQAELAGLAVTALGLAAMLRPLGITGAAIASVLGYSTVTVVLVLSVRHYLGPSPSELLIFRRSDFVSLLQRLSLTAERPPNGCVTAPSVSIRKRWPRKEQAKKPN
jgi:O-antigen/teichoic acid export membrane protein